MIAIDGTVINPGHEKITTTRSKYKDRKALGMRAATALESTLVRHHE
jgi:hypothetical protein